MIFKRTGYTAVEIQKFADYTCNLQPFSESTIQLSINQIFNGLQVGCKLVATFRHELATFAKKQAA